MGSIGVGFTINKGVEAEISKSKKTAVYFNKEYIHFPTVESVIRRLTDKKIRVLLNSPLPLGYGFGLSGASALATAFALNKELNLSKNRDELVRIAHIAEIENKTGLGSVGTQATGGFLLKTSPGLPVKTIKYPFIKEKIHLYIIDRLLTSEVLSNKNNWRQINKAADFELKKISGMKNPSFNDMVDASYYYALKSKLLTNPKLLEIINGIRKKSGHASITMLGQVVLSTSRFPQPDKGVLEELVITNDKIRFV